MDKAKKDYFQACRQERTAINQDKNAQADTSISPDQQKKLAEKAEKCREEREKTQDEYKKVNALNLHLIVEDFLLFLSLFRNYSMHC